LQRLAAREGETAAFPPTKHLFLSQNEYKPMSALHDTTRQHLLTFHTGGFMEQIFKNSFSASQRTQFFSVMVTNQLVQ
jgi:hypothetical protein